MKPKSIKRDNYYLIFDWEDGHQSRYTVSFLRRHCPCAVCKKIREEDKDGTLEIDTDLLFAGSIHIKSFKAQGHYAIKFDFSDRHSAGIYRYEYIRELCLCDECKLNSA